jgi:ribosomal protein S6E (S10)
MSRDNLFTSHRHSASGKSMTVKIKVKSSESGSSVDMELEGENTVNEIIDSAAGYWGMNAGAYVLRRGKTLLRGAATVADIGIVNGDVVELIPDPEGG